MALIMGACSSARKATEAPLSSSKKSIWNTGESVVSRSNVSLATSKGKDITVGGTLRMKRDDVIQLNLTYILGIQIGTLEMTRDSILVLSRTTRQYALFSYDELSSLMERKITFQDMQAIFWGEATEYEVKGIDWKYKSFHEQEDGRRLPEKYDITFSRAGAGITMSVELFNHKYEGNWTPRTQFNRNSYERLTAGQVVRIVSLLIGG